ncbi:MAG: VOC family protein [Planctomycetota bacterium]
MATHVPAGYTAVTPYLLVPDVEVYLAFLASGLGAREVERHAGPDGTCVHGEAEIAGARVMVGRAPERAGGALLYHFVDDVDGTWRRLLDLGATPLREPADQEYGHRTAAVTDAAGHQWWLARPR